MSLFDEVTKLGNSYSQGIADGADLAYKVIVKYLLEGVGSCSMGCTVELRVCQDCDIRADQIERLAEEWAD